MFVFAFAILPRILQAPFLQGTGWKVFFGAARPQVLLVTGASLGRRAQRNNSNHRGASPTTGFRALNAKIAICVKRQRALRHAHFDLCRHVNSP
jgi:hypothetical protein